MDYKKLLPNQEFRIKVLGLLDFLPDKLMIKLQYLIKTGKRLNLKKPKRFTEKLQWYKLYYRDPLMTQCADKYSVREYVASKGFREILVPLHGVYSQLKDINFNLLPNKFVFKTNNGSRTNLLCKNKEDLDIHSTKKTLHSWLSNRTVKAGREWPYYNIEPKIICEEYIETGSSSDLVDYKFVCFSGQVSYIFVNSERDSTEGLVFSIYDRDFQKVPYKRKGLRNTDINFTKPVNYEKMVEIAEKLSEDFPHVRVDLYNVDGKIYFGEMTFFHGSGYIEFEPDHFDFLLGAQFHLKKMVF
ncbi:ATP-grasp fold amidoligase family protein [Natribacillus halophilus]|uniref:TupA-like ATPgrasp n=1 Tax=Natribacillus halophilus TaxID=549003 RepID=A0A1G8KFI8_9BACI|nr:ATP-grasp fold amidoligase family protein [Natribacillus halophilus]SDI42184.1 TupA-like ATPgrasp [Natribacillus halophilus]